MCGDGAGERRVERRREELQRKKKQDAGVAYERGQQYST